MKAVAVSRRRCCGVAHTRRERAIRPCREGVQRAVVVCGGRVHHVLEHAQTVTRLFDQSTKQDVSERSRRKRAAETKGSFLSGYREAVIPSGVSPSK